MTTFPDRLEAHQVEAAAWRAIRAIPPAWPLDATVAVNPFLGQTGLDLAQAGARIARAYGARVTMPAEWYADRIARGEIGEADLAAALDEAPEAVRRLGPAGLAAAAGIPSPPPPPLATVADVVAGLTGLDWPAILVERMTGWAGGYFDEGQALWRSTRSASPFASWRLTATHDLTPEILGLPGFAAHVATAPDTALKAIERAAGTLGLGEAALEPYFHRALASLGGWSQLARQKLWQAELAGSSDETALALLAARLVWDEALFTVHRERLSDIWPAARARFAEPAAPTREQAILATLQAAYDHAVQRRLLARLGQTGPNPAIARPALQAAFCIDVRSEVFRRALEACDDRIETLGFAGFFGLGLEHRRLGSDIGERRLPVLLNPSVHTTAAPEAGRADWTARIAARGARAWGRFKLAAVSSFAFVEASGPFYAAKLLADSLGLPLKGKAAEPAPRLADSLTAEARTQAAETVLRAMSLTERFAPLVLLIGHGAKVTNNPHASGLHCGACGGYPGDVNARLLARLLNEPEVRAGLAKRGIAVPDDTRFVAGLHDTTSDRVELFTDDVLLNGHQRDLARAGAWLQTAGRLARAERAMRLPGAPGGESLRRRGGDWSEVRPEWALAGCQAFVAGPRAISAGTDLGGRVFLHDYAWRRDKGFKVLELILTAPVVVASWISLQYYGSTVAPDVFGSGNKLLHNVIGGIGVLEGGAGSLRVGLSRQSIHDGSDLAHDPVRLSVCVAAPKEAIADILRLNDQVRDLFDHGWLNLFVLDDRGQAVARYRPGMRWSPLAAAPGPADVQRAVA